MLIALWVLLIVINIVDAIQTIQALDQPDFDEMNPIARFFFDHLGVFDGVIVAKALIICFIAVCTHFIPQYSVYLLLATIIWGGFIVLHNYQVMNED